jgi:glycerol uptake facilitator protein
MPATVLGEFLGTLVLLLLGNGVVAGVLLDRSKAFGAGWMAITTGWALAVFAGVSVALALGAPAELNPAVTFANVLGGSRPLSEAVWHVAAQLAGAMGGAALVWLHFLPHWGPETPPDAIRACFCTAPAIRRPLANVLSEAIATAVLVLLALALGSAGVAGATPATNLGAVLIAAVVWGIGLSLGGPTGFAINPARDLGPRVMHALLPVRGKTDSDWGYAAVPIAGPLAGAAVAALLWRAVTG